MAASPPHEARGDVSDFLRQLGEYFAPLGVDRPFEMLYLCPFAVALSHI